MSASPPKILTDSYYARLDELEQRHWWCRSVRRLALAWARDMDRNAAILDAGCGTGGFLSAMAKEGFRGRAVGLDVASEALARARRDHGLALLTRGSASDLPIAPGSLDLVILHDVLQHLPAGDDGRALAEAHRALKPGGILLLRTNVGSPIGGSDALHRRYSASGLAGLVRSAGFRVERHRLLHPAMALLGRLRSRRAGGHSTGEAGLSTAIPPAPINLALGVASRVSDALASGLPFRMPVGDVQVLRGRKPARGSVPARGGKR
jgi:SAM-dependent methyltransferase